MKEDPHFTHTHWHILWWSTMALEPLHCISEQMIPTSEVRRCWQMLSNGIQVSLFFISHYGFAVLVREGTSLQQMAKSSSWHSCNFLLCSRKATGMTDASSKRVCWKVSVDIYWKVVSQDTDWGEDDCTNSTWSSSSSSALWAQTHTRSGCVCVACTISVANSWRLYRESCDKHYLSSILHSLPVSYYEAAELKCVLGVGLVWCGSCKPLLLWCAYIPFPGFEEQMGIF